MHKYEFGVLPGAITKGKLTTQNSPQKLKQQLNLIDDYGLTAESLDTFKPHLEFGKNRNTNTVKLAELWGAKSSQKLLIRSKLKEAAQIFKFECWKNERKLMKLKGSPILPHRLDNLVGNTSRMPVSVESQRVFRVYSPQIELRKEKKEDRADRVEKIDEIIKNCTEFRWETKKGLPNLKNVGLSECHKIKLTKNEKMNIKNIMKILDHKRYNYK